jgi:hypothetical protein
VAALLVVYRVVLSSTELVSYIINAVRLIHKMQQKGIFIKFASSIVRVTNIAMH